MDNDLNDVLDLVVYFKKHLSFKKLRNCGKLSDEELQQVVRKYFSDDLFISDQNSQQLDLVEVDESTSIFHLHKELFELDVRAYNACTDNGIKTLGDLATYFHDHLTFQEFRNCGRKSSIQLINVLEKYVFSTRGNQTNENQQLYVSANPQLKQKLYSYVTLLTSSLTGKGMRVLKDFLGNSSDSILITEMVIQKDFYKIYKHLPNHGNLGHKEILDYFHELEIGIESLLHEKAIDEGGLSSVIGKFSVDSKSNNNSMFQLANTLIDQNKLFDSQRTDILKSILKLYKNQQVLSLTDVTEKTGVYEAKVLKFKSHCLSSLQTKLAVLKSYENQLNSKYQVQSEGDLLVIDEKKADEINSISETYFSKQFITYILSIFLSDEFITIGNISDALIFRHGHPMGRHEWKNIYLLRKEIDFTINFEAFVEDIGNRLEERITQSYSFNLASYLSRFGKVDKPSDYNRLMPIAETLMHHEFGLVVDLNDNVTFERNTLKKVSEYAFEALKTLGSPSTVEVIFDKVKELYPDFSKDEKSIQASMTRQKGFVPIGRKSTYGLKEWEDTLAGFKGGTIRNIVMEFLERHESPQHLDDVTADVLRFRPKSNKNSVRMNLKLDASNTFSFFKGDIVGLKSKDYNEFEHLTEDIVQVQIRSWDEYYNVLQEFLIKNGSLPRSSNCPESEIAIYRWVSRQKRALKKDSLSKIQKDKIKSILGSESKSAGLYTKTIENYESLRDFIRDNERIPKAGIDSEYRLYSFLYTKTKRYEQELLSDEELLEFNKIKMLIDELPKQSKLYQQTIENYRLLRNFIISKGRIPKASIKSEYRLYSFLYTKTKRYNQDELSDEELAEFIKIKQLLSTT